MASGATQELHQIIAVARQVVVAVAESAAAGRQIAEAGKLRYSGGRLIFTREF